MPYDVPTGSEIKAEDLQFTPPDVPADEIGTAVERHFGLSGEIVALEGERDRNFRLTAPDGGVHVVKLASAHEPPEITDFLVRGLDHIARHAPDLPVPRHYRTADGSTVVRVGLEDGKTYSLRVLDFLDGVRLQDGTPPDLDMLRTIGVLQGDLARALAGFFDPAAEHFVAWDISSGLVLNRTLVDGIEPEHRPLTDPLLARLSGGLQARIGGLRAQVIHGDMHAGNILCDAADPTRITGVIDFGDMVHAPLICDLGVSGASYLEYTDDPLAGIAALVEGFHARFPLLEEEIDVLHDLILVRLVLSLELNAFRRALADCPAYIRAMYPQAIANLQRFAAIDPDRARARYRMACGFASDFHAGWTPPDNRSLAARRAKALGPSYSLFYETPIQIVKGQGVWLWDAAGKRYLDCYNNVASVGHCHPHVVGAVSRQIATLNTHTRYLHEEIVRYAERLGETLPGDLGTCILVCTGTEANDLAFQIARAVTGKTGAVVTERAYHGNSIAVTGLSPSEYPADERPDHVEIIDAPDRYRGRLDVAPGDIGPAYAAQADEAIAALEARGHGVAMFLGDAVFDGYGILEAPTGYFENVYRRIRAAGGLVVADEVQSGLCRLGENMWAIMDSGVVPDIVTMGKPMGDGHPLAVVAMTPEIAEAFARHTGYFNTFGGNPVAAAAGNAVLDVVEREALLANVARSGNHLAAGLRTLAERRPLIGNLRGKGLFVGVELVRDRTSREPATSETARVVEHMKDNGVLVSLVGEHRNTIKIRPPLVIRPEHIDRLLAAMDDALNRVG